MSGNYVSFESAGVAATPSGRLSKRQNGQGVTARTFRHGYKNEIQSTWQYPGCRLVTFTSPFANSGGLEERVLDNSILVLVLIQLFLSLTKWVPSSSTPTTEEGAE